MAKRNKIHRLPYDKRPAVIREQEAAAERLLTRNLEQEPTTPTSTKKMLDKAAREVKEFTRKLGENQ